MSYYNSSGTNGGGGGTGGGGGYYDQQQYGGQNQQYGGQQQQGGGGYQTGYGDNSGWQQQQQQQQQYPQQQGSQQQQQYQQNQFVQQSTQPQQSAPSFWNPATAATMAAMAASTVASGGSMSNDTVLDFATTASKSFFQSGTARMIPGLESAMLLLRSYFAVDNKFVVRKMKRVLLPVLIDKQGWNRQVCDVMTLALQTYHLYFMNLMINHGVKVALLREHSTP